LETCQPRGSLNLLRSSHQLLGLATIDFLVSIAHQVLPAVFVLYTGHRYGWDEATVGLTLAFVGICSAIVQGLLIGPVVTWFGKRRVLIGCLLLGGLSMTIYGLAPSGPWFRAGVPLMALWGIAGAVTRDLMTQRVSPAEQGQLQGANNSSRSIAGLIGPGIFAGIFAHLLDSEPGAPSCWPPCSWSWRRA
jgi:DHA1 family tetracycline resistance protein-like MFS transporter